MDDIIRHLSSLFDPTVENAYRWADIVIVAFLIYRILILIRGKRTWRVVIGILMFVMLFIVSQKLHLQALHYILDKALILGPVALAILLLPELRQALEGLGRLRILDLAATDSYSEERIIDEIVAGAYDLASQKIGALIVIEKASQLDEVVASGVRVMADVSAPLLGSIFYEGNPLHDGAAVIRGEKIMAAACRLPLSESNLDRSIHMRHRAAVGVTETFDCVVVVVSEERGTVSVASNGLLTKMSDPATLRKRLQVDVLGQSGPEGRPKLRRARREETKVS